MLKFELPVIRSLAGARAVLDGRIAADERKREELQTHIGPLRKAMSKIASRDRLQSPVPLEHFYAYETCALASTLTIEALGKILSLSPEWTPLAERFKQASLIPDMTITKCRVNTLTGIDGLTESVPGYEVVVSAEPKGGKALRAQ